MGTLGPDKSTYEEFIPLLLHLPLIGGDIIAPRCRKRLLAFLELLDGPRGRLGLLL